jgi:hypothetical protein
LNRYIDVPNSASELLPKHSGPAHELIEELRAVLLEEIKGRISLRRLSGAIGRAENYMRRALKEGTSTRRLGLLEVLQTCEPWASRRATFSNACAKFGQIWSRTS